MKKVIKINESDLGHIINEVMDEISLKTLQNAAGKYGCSYDGFCTNDEELENAFKVIANRLEEYGEYYENPEANTMLQNAIKGLESIKAYFKRKFAQADNLQDTRDAASYMRRKEFGDDYDEYEEHNGQITPDEYSLVNGYQNKRQVIDSINQDLKKAVGNKFITLPYYYMPKVAFKSTYDTDVSTLNIKIDKSMYDKCIGIVKKVMSEHGYRMSGEKNTMNNRGVVTFEKV